MAVFVLFNNVLSLSSSPPYFLAEFSVGMRDLPPARSPSFKSKNFQLPNSTTTAGAGDDEQSGGISAGNEWDGERARDGAEWSTGRIKSDFI